MLATTITPENIVMIIDGVSFTVPRSAAQAKDILNELRQPVIDTEKVKKLVNLVFALELYVGDDCTINKDGTVTRNGVVLPPVLGKKILACYKEGVPYSGLLKFFDNLNANPSKTAVHELYDFLEHMGMPIDVETGNVLGYKGISEDGYSVRGGDNSKLIKGKANAQGRIFNGIGEEIEVQRNYVEDNRDIGCAAGLHIGAEQYAVSWGPKVIVVSFSPRDVISIPRDCNFQKLRVCAYKVVAEYKGRMTDGGVFNPSNPYEDIKDEDPLEEDIEGCSCDDCDCDEDCYDQTPEEYVVGLGTDDRDQGEFPRSRGGLLDEVQEVYAAEELEDQSLEELYATYCAAYRGQ